MGSPVMKRLQIHRGLILATLAFVAGSFAFVAASAVADAKGSVFVSSGISGGSVQASVESGDSVNSMRVLGYVFGAPGEGALPVRVRAVGVGGSVCGTADVEVIAPDVGFFALTVVGAASKAGCPSAGGVVGLTLHYGYIDDGVLAAPSVLPVFEYGATRVVMLSRAGDASGVAGWQGDVPSAGGVALLRWGGPSGMPMGQAVQLLPVMPVSVWARVDGGWLRFVPGGPSALQSLTEVEHGALVVGVFRP